jgi:hypothetical protein
MLLAHIDTVLYVWMFWNWYDLFIASVCYLFIFHNFIFISVSSFLHLFLLYALKLKYLFCIHEWNYDSTFLKAKYALIVLCWDTSN